MRLQKWFHFRPPATEHIVCLQYLGIVQINIGIGIQTVKAELYMVFPSDDIRSQECGFIDSVLLINPLYFPFIKTNIGVVN